MIVIESNIIGAVLCFALGIVVASVSYAVSRAILKKCPEKYASYQIVRQILQVGYLILLFAFGGYTPWDSTYLLVGGALGITLPMIWFTYRLVKLNSSSQGKEERSDG